MIVGLLALQIGPDQFVAALVGALAGAPVVAAAFSKQREQASQTWKDLAEGRAAQVDDLSRKVAHLEAKVDLLGSDFVRTLAHEVTSAVAEALAEKLP